MRRRCSRSVGFVRVVSRWLLVREGALSHHIVVNELASAHATCPVGAPTELASAHATCAVRASTPGGEAGALVNEKAVQPFGGLSIYLPFFSWAHAKSQFLFLFCYPSTTQTFSIP